MLTAFERTLLHAHRCKFTQYLIFFLALKDPQRCCSSFSACLMSLLRDPRQPPITRSACAAYLASFLARCALAPKDLVLDVTVKLASCCQEYADSVMQQNGGTGVGLTGRSSSSSGLVLLQGSGSSSSNGAAAAGPLAQVQRHQAFYAMVQALLYVLCYHMQPLLGSQLQQQQQQQQQEDAQPLDSQQQQQQQLAEGVEQLVRQQVLPLLSHPLAPLAVCHQAVTHEFVRQALLLGLADAPSRGRCCECSSSSCCDWRRWWGRCSRSSAWRAAAVGSVLSV
jgi:RNA polymerase I-specific transcription initiation factor RRN3